MEKNIILENLEKISGVKEDLYNHLDLALSKIDNIFYQDESATAKILEGDSNRYLLVKRPEGISVYSESKQFRSNPFSYANVKEEQIYSTVILKVPNEKYTQEKNKEIFDTYKDLPKELIAKLIKMETRLSKRANSFTVTQSLFGLEEFLSKVGTPKSIEKAKIVNNGKLDFLIEDLSLILDTGIISYNIDRLYTGSVSNKFNINNKFEFNDLDNHVWVQNKKLCFSSQNFVFVVDKKDNDWNVYVAPYDKDILKESLSLQALVKKIDSGTVDDIKNTVLKIKDNKVAFIDPYVFNIMISELGYSKMALEDEGLIPKAITPGLKLLSPNEYIVNSIHNYPTLYLKYSFEQSKIAVLDHVLNVIGSGSDDFERMIMGKPQLFSDIEPWFGENKVYELEKNGSRNIVFEDSADTMEIKKDKDYYHIPYPNFQKRYSLVHSENYKVMSDDWKKAALDFYLYAKDFFQDKNKSKFYHYAFEIESLTKPEKTDTEEYKKLSRLYNTRMNLISDMKKAFEKKTEDQITKDYGVEFIGGKTNDADICKFLENRWLKEKTKIEQFLDETITMLEGDLNKTKKMKM
mgnify:CR=1 FL=1